jgi:D-alanyl-D-alanine carboxypeptidase
MIIEDITQQSFQHEIEHRLFKAADLNNTFYPVPALDKKAANRVANGFGFNPYDNPELLGKDIHNISLSWAGAAGAVISNTSDIIKWVKALFVDDKILDPQQKQEMMQMVSTISGQPLTSVSSNDPEGFALGVTQRYRKEIGTFWFYEGETLGYRALYMYVPANGIIISAIFNSAVNHDNDHAGELMQNIYNIAKQNSATPST